MTIDRAPAHHGGAMVKAVRTIAGVAAVLGIWTLVMLAIPFVGPGSRQVAVLGDRASAVRAVTIAGGRIVELRRGAVIARADTPGFPARLYAAGAGAVIEGRVAAGCFAKAGA